MLDAGQGSLGTLAIALAGRVPVQLPAQTTTIVQGTNMPGARFRPGVASDAAGNVYVTGGNTSGAGTGVVTGAYRIAMDGTVTSLPAMPQAIYSHGSAVDSTGRVYVFGGFTGSNYTNATYRYSPTLNTWETLPVLPTSVYALAGTSDSLGRIYAIGGYNENFTSTAVNTIYRFDPAAAGGTGAWSTLNPMPSGRYEIGVTCAGSFIYVAGGYGASEIVSATSGTQAYRYDINTGTWTTLPSLAVGRRGPAVGSDLAGRVYVAGGQTPSSNANAAYLNTITRYDPLTNVWTQLPITMRFPRGFTGAVRDLNGRIVIPGGGTADNSAAITVERIVPDSPDVLTPAWAQVTNNLGAGNTNWYGQAASSDGTVVYTSHGYRNGGASNFLQTLTPAGVVTTGPVPSTARLNVASAYANGKHYVIGGEASTASTPLAAVEAYTPAGTNGASGTWATVASLPTTVGFGAAVTVGNFIYFAGGRTGATIQTALYRYDTTTNTWATLAIMPSGRYGGMLAHVSGKLYYIGGLDTNAVEWKTTTVYDITANTWSTPAALTAPTGNYYGGAGTVGSVIHVVNSVQQYNMLDTTTNTWSTGPSLTAARTGQFGFAMIGPAMYVLGGANGGVSTSADTYDTSRTLTPLGRRVRTLQQFLLAAGLPVAAQAAGRIPKVINPMTWATVTSTIDTQLQRWYAAASTDGTLIYVHGGLLTSNSTVQGGIFSINPTTGVTTVGPGTVTRYFVSGAFLAGKHYSVGGVQGNGTYVGTVEAYTPAGTGGMSGSWATVATLPTVAALPMVCAHQGLLWSFGGTTNGSGTGGISTIYSYNPSTNVWTTRGTLPTPLFGGSAVPIGSFIYIVGGNNATSQVSSVYRFDPSTNTTTLTGLSVESGYGRAAAVGSNIYTVVDSANLSSLINVATGTALTSVVSSNYRGTQPNLVTVGNSVYLIGGGQNAQYLDRLDFTGLVVYPPSVSLTKSLVAAGV